MTSLTAPTLSSLTAAELSGGVIVSTLSPFGDDGRLMLETVTDQVERLCRMDGIKGIAVHSTVRERRTLTSAERINVVFRTRAGMNEDQLLLVCVGELSDAIVDDIWAYRRAGANAAVAFPTIGPPDDENLVDNQEIDRLAELADKLPLPIILALGTGGSYCSAKSEVIEALAADAPNIIGFDLGADDNVLNYDQDYYALKAVDRPLACLPSSEAALFHNLNTGADGVLSCLAFIAPHEVSELYQASRDHRFCDAQVIHNRLSPLIGLLAGHDQKTREMIYRVAAHYRGLLTSPDARNLKGTLPQKLKTKIYQTLDNIGLKPVKAD